MKEVRELLIQEAPKGGVKNKSNSSRGRNKAISRKQTAQVSAGAQKFSAGPLTPVPSQGVVGGKPTSPGCPNSAFSEKCRICYVEGYRSRKGPKWVGYDVYYGCGKLDTKTDFCLAQCCVERRTAAFNALGGGNTSSSLPPRQ